MAIDPNRRQQRPQPYLPQIGFGIPAWLRTFLVEVKHTLENLTVDPGPPGQPTNLRLTRAYPGILVQWNRTLGAARYLVYRNTVATFSSAAVVQVMNNIDNISVLDVTQSESSTATLYYWVVAQNSQGMYGPVSAMVSVANSVAPASGQIDIAAAGELAFRAGLDSFELPAVLAMGNGSDTDITIFDAEADSDSFGSQSNFVETTAETFPPG